MKPAITIGIVDDHSLFLEAFTTLIGNFGSFKVIFQAGNGQEALHKLEELLKSPDIMLIDINMPVMDGLTTVQRIEAKFQTIKTVALCMQDDGQAIANMLNVGCCAYIFKDIDPSELNKALLQISTEGTYKPNPSTIYYYFKMDGFI